MFRYKIPIYKKRSLKPRAKKVAKKRGMRSKAGVRRNRGRKALVSFKQQGLGSQTVCKHVVNFKGDSRARVLKQVAVPSYQLVNGIGNVASLSGGQGFSMQTIGTQAQLSNLGQYLTDRNGLTSNGGVGRFLLESIKSSQTFVNRSTLPCKLRLFLVSPKRDTWFPPSNNPVDTMVYTTPGGSPYSWGGEPISAIREGVNAEYGTAAGTVTTMNTAGTKPTDSRLFTSYYKIIHEQEVLLAQGGSHTYEIVLNFDRVLDASQYSNTPLTALRGVTHYVVVQVEGLMAIDSTGSIQTLAPANVAWEYEHTYKATTCLNAQTNFNVINNLAFAPTANISINPGSGIATTQQFA